MLNEVSATKQAALMKVVAPEVRKYPCIVSAIGPVNPAPGFEKYLILVKDNDRYKMIEVELGYIAKFYAAEVKNLTEFEGFIAPFMQELRGERLLAFRAWLNFLKQIGAEVDIPKPIRWSVYRAKECILGPKIGAFGGETEYQKELMIFEELGIKVADRLIQIRRKYKGKITGDYDKEIQQLYIEELHKRFPEWRFIAEERVEPALQDDGEAEYVCMIDPIDGTWEFNRSYDYSKGEYPAMLRRHVEYGTGLALFRRVNGKLKPVVSVGILPELDIDGEGFSIVEMVDGVEGAFLNGARIRPSHPAAKDLDLKKMSVIVEPRRGQEEIGGKIAGEFGKAHIDVCSLAHFLFLALGESRSKVAGHMGARPRIWDTVIGGSIAQKAGVKLVYLSDRADVFDLDPKRWDDDFSTDNIFAGDEAVVSHILSRLGLMRRPQNLEMIIEQAA